MIPPGAALRHLQAPALEALTLEQSFLSPAQEGLIHHLAELHELRSLSVEGLQAAALLPTLLDTPLTTRLERLSMSLGLGGWDTHTASALASAPWSALQALQLRDITSAEQLTALLQPDAWPALRELDLTASLLGAEGAAALAAWPGLERLTALRLPECRLGDDGLSALLRSPWLPPHLQHLDLGANALCAGCAALAAAPLPALRTLSLARNRIGSPEAKLLAGSRTLTALEELDLTSNKLRDAALRAMATSPQLGSLTSLRLGHNPGRELGITNPPHLRIFWA